MRYLAPPSSPGLPGGQPTARIGWFVSALRGHPWLFFCTWAVLPLLAWLAWMGLPTRYTATSSVLIQVNTTDPIAGIALPGGMMSSHLSTQSEVMQSERVALRAMQALRPDETATWRKRWQEATGGRGMYENWVAQQLLQQLEVRKSRESNVLVLAFKDADPDRAARMANAMVQSYVDTAVDLRLQPARQYSTFFDERVQRAKESLDAMRARLVEFQQRNGLHSLDERSDVEERRLAELASQITLIEGKLAESRGKQGEAGGAASQEAVRDPVVIEARIELAKQEARLSELESRLGEGHPQLIDQQQAVNQRRISLAAAVGRATQTIRSGGNAEAAQLKLLKTAYDQQNRKVLDRKALREEGLRMQKEVDSLQRNYELVLARYQHTTLESEDKQPNASVLKVATPPFKPSTPAVWTFLGAGVLLGLAAALAAVFMRERHDGRLRHAEHVIEVLQKPFLVQLPTRGRAIAKSSGSAALSNESALFTSHENR